MQTYTHTQKGVCERKSVLDEESTGGRTGPKIENGRRKKTEADMVG